MHPFSNRLRGKLLTAFLLLVVCLSPGAGTLAQQPPPPTPTLLTPPPAFITSNSRPTLSWQAVAGAESYEVLVANNPEFVNARQNVQVVNGTHFTSGQLDNGTYYWRVRSVFPNGARGAWSAARQFKVDITYPVRETWMGESWVAVPHFGVTGDPTGKIVINELCAGCFLLAPDFRAWIELYNADTKPVDMTNWKLSVYSSANILSIVYYFPPGFTLAPGAYVTVYELDGTNTADSLFLGDGILIPYPDSDYRGAIALQSTAPTGIDFVRFRSSFFGSSSVAPPAGTTWIGPDPLSNQVEFSLGRDAFSFDSNKGADWSEQGETPGAANTPTITKKPATAPVQVAPAANAFVNASGDTVSWNPVYGAADYYLQVSTSATCASPYVLDAPLLTALNYDLGLSTEGNYYWRVSANNVFGTGPWSTCRKLTYDITAPTAAPVQTSPINGAVVTLPKPTLVWKSVAGAARYEVGLERGNSVDPETVATVTTLSFVPPNNLVTGRYFWRVRALDAAGNAGPWGNADVPEDFWLMSSSSSAPVLNQSDVDLVPVSWVGIGWANAYEIQVDNNSTFNSLEYVEQDIPRYSESWTVGPLPAEGLYYWRIRARKDDNTWGAWSKTQSFYVNIP